MKTINLRIDIKKQFEKEGLTYPRLKSSGRWGLRGSTLLDRNTEKEAVDAALKHLSVRGIIRVCRR